MILLDAAFIGLVNAIVIEVLKLLGRVEDKNVKKVIAFITALILSFIYIASNYEDLSRWDLGIYLVTSLSMTFVIYKAVIDPVKVVVGNLFSKIKG